MIDESLTKAAENASRVALRCSKQFREAEARHHAERAFVLIGAALGLDAGYVQSTLGTRAMPERLPYYRELLARLNADTEPTFSHERDTRPIDAR